MSTGGVGVGGSEPVGTSAWTRLAIDKCTCMHAELYFGHLWNAMQIYRLRKITERKSWPVKLIDLVQLMVSPMLFAVGVV